MLLLRGSEASAHLSRDLAIAREAPPPTCGVAVANAAGHHIGVPKGAKAKMVMLLTIFKIQAHGAKIRCLVSLMRR
jgi:hypothetical protein